MPEPPAVMIATFSIDMKFLQKLIPKDMPQMKCAFATEKTCHQAIIIA
jgi:hypothetical protein